MPASSALLALGSNLGDRERHLARGLQALAESGLVIVERSSLYETEPVGGPEQGPYLNQVVRARTELSPEEVLAAGLQAERQEGRRRGARNAPRTLDVDLLLYDDLVRDAGALTLPHPRLHERRFVLVPLCEIAPGVRHPLLGRTAAELLAACPDRSQVRLYRLPAPKR